MERLPLLCVFQGRIFAYSERNGFYAFHFFFVLHGGDEARDEKSQQMAGTAQTDSRTEDKEAVTIKNKIPVGKDMLLGSAAENGATLNVPKNTWENTKLPFLCGGEKMGITHSGVFF